MPSSATPVQLVNPNTGVPYTANGNSDAAGNTQTVDGGRYNSTLPTLANGQRGDLQLGNRGQLFVQLFEPASASGYNGTPMNADGINASQFALNVASFNVVYNQPSNTWTRALGDTNGSYVVNKGGSSIATGQVNVTTSSTLVAAARTGRQKITLSPTSNTVYYVGVNGVSTATGVYVAAGGTITLDTAAAIYAVGAAAFTLSYIEYF